MHLRMKLLPLTQGDISTFQEKEEQQEVFAKLLLFAKQAEEIESFAQLKAMMKQLDLPKTWLKKYITFKPAPAKYSHHQIFWTPVIEVSGFGWESGQESDAHAHINLYKNGFSTAVIKILEGTGVNRIFQQVDESESGEKLIVGCQTQELKAGEIAIVHPGEIHVFGNKSHSPLVTLHTYYPPLGHLTAEERPKYRIVG